MKKRSHVFRGAAGIFLALLVLLQIAAQVANSWAGKVNELLGVSDSAIERSTNPEDYRYLSDFENPSDLIQAEIGLNTRLAAEGSVVLKGTPAIDGTQVTLFGMRSGEKMQFGGSMGELTDASNLVTLADAMATNGFSVNPDMVQFYKDMAADYAPVRTSGGNVVSSYEGQGTTVNEVSLTEYQAKDIGDYTDAAVVVFGRDAGESCCFYPGLNGLANPDEFSRSSTGNILSLSNEERDLLSYVKQQGFDKIVVLLNSSGAMEVEELKQDSGIDCVMWIGNPGAYGTYGIAKLLSGEVLPSGHLPDTFAVNSSLSPAVQNFGIYNFANASSIDTSSNHALRSDWYLVEAEGIYTGYKYYETRYFDVVAGQGNAYAAKPGQTVDGSELWEYDKEVSWSFGYGVEGSSFSEEIINADIDWSGERESTVTVKVTNTGRQAAKHVVQLYVSLPYTDNDKHNGVEKSAIQLIGYAKTGEAQEKTFEDVVLLEPGAFEDVTVTFNAQDFYTYDRTYQHDGVTGAYVLEAGDYLFATGNGAHDAVLAVLKELYPTRTADVQPSGALHKESLSTDTYLTQSNGATIQNQLDGADLNTLGTGISVTYLTRSDWANTFPNSIETITATEEMVRLLQNEIYNAEESLENYDGPSEFAYGVDNGLTVANLVGLDYDDPMFDQVLDEMTLEDLINQYIAYLEDLPTVAFPKEQPADSPLGIIGTIGQRNAGSIYEVAQDDPAYGYHLNSYVGAPTVAATFSPFLQKEEGRLIGNDALWSGYTTWFGPGLNLHRTPYNGRNVGYYSEDSVLTGQAAMYVHRGLDTKGVVTNAKHFAFNDQETNRDGLAVFLNEQAARENELRGFQIPVRDGSMKGIMSAFNRIGCTHVAAHTGLMNGILLGEWGFKGYLMTDSVKSAQYFLPRECLVAGNNLMLGGSNNGKVWNFTTDEVSKDPVIQNALRESFHRKLYFYANSVLMNGITPDANATHGIVWWALMLQIAGGVCFIGFAAFLILYILGERKNGISAGNSGLEIVTGIISALLTAVALALFAMSYTTGYYIFGQMQSPIIAVLIGTAISVEIAAIVLRRNLPNALWPKLLTFAVTALLCAAAMLLVGDRVEGIGNCIVTDYDSGHGGEEAIYMSLAASIFMLIAVVYNLIGSFSTGKRETQGASEEKNKGKKPGLIRNVGFALSTAAVLLAVLIPTASLVRGGSANLTDPGSVQGGSGGTYTVSFNQGNGNAEKIPGYQFLCGNLGGLVQADSRLYVDITLTLDGNGNYTLFSDGYVIESGKRCEIGDDTGLGMVITTTAEGSYTENSDGTVTTAPATHAVVTMQTDTYSSQMKGPAGLQINGSDADGVYDSNDEPTVLDFVPETVWTLGDGEIVTYQRADGGDEPGSEAGTDGMTVLSDDEATSMTFFADGTYKFAFDAYNIEDAGTYTYKDGVLTVTDKNGKETTAGGDPLKLHYEYSESDQLTGDFTIPATDLTTTLTGRTGTGDGLTIPSDDEATSMTFFADGTYKFAFDAYNIEDAGTYTYKDGVLTVTDKNGKETTAEGDPLKLHYEYSESDQLTGDFTIPATDLTAALNGEGEADNGMTVPSDDGATSITFNVDGTYIFAFDAYGIEDSGTWTYEDGVLTVTDKNGKETTAEGDPLKLHYEYSESDQLTGDFAISVAELQK